MSARLLAVAVLGGAGLLFAPGPAGANETVALLPIVVHSSTPESDYLSAGLADMLSARLEQGGGITVTRVETNARTTKREAAVEAARNAGADYVVFGSFTQFGSGASLDVRCARVTASDDDEDGDARRVFVQSGALGDIIPKLDDLAVKLRRHVNGQATQVSATPAAGGEAAATPADAEALDELRRRVDALERAVYVEHPAAPESATEDAGTGETGAFQEFGKAPQ